MNLQIAVQSVDNIYGVVLDAGMQPVVPIEERWYEVDVVAPTGKWTASGTLVSRSETRSAHSGR